MTYQSPKLNAIGVRNGFSTRIGGVSDPPYDTLNLGYLTKQRAPDDNTKVAENFRRLRRALGMERVIRVQVNQAHGAEAWVPPREPVKLAEAPEADAMVSREPAHMLTVRVADCVPLLLAGPSGSVVAAVHAGWRGIVAGVIGAAIDTMRARFAVDPGHLAAAVGPCIGAERFEVGEEVAERFRQAGLPGVIVEPAGAEKPHIDLAAAAVQRLEEGGVRADRIDRSDRCTHRDEAEFFSHRRDEGRTGRMAAVIQPKRDAE